jgi:hypothetical protein
MDETFGSEKRGHDNNRNHNNNNNNNNNKTISAITIMLLANNLINSVYTVLILKVVMIATNKVSLLRAGSDGTARYFYFVIDYRGHHRKGIAI